MSVGLCGETPSSRAVNHVYRPSFSVTHFRSTATGAAPTWVSITWPTTWLGTDLAGQPPEGDRERVAAGTQRLGLVILGLILAAGRRAASTERPCERSSASRFWVSRIWVCRSTRRWLPPVA
jgi:hypothetical protein